MSCGPHPELDLDDLRDKLEILGDHLGLQGMVHLLANQSVRASKGETVIAFCPTCNHHEEGWPINTRETCGCCGEWIMTLDYILGNYLWKDLQP